VIQIDVPVPPDVQPWMGPKPSPEAAQRQSGAPWAICITPGPTQYLYSSDAYPGRVYKLSLDGKVLGTFGTSGRQLKEFGWIHEIACPSENTIYVAEILNWRVQKLLLHPEKAKSSPSAAMLGPTIHEFLANAAKAALSAAEPTSPDPCEIHAGGGSAGP